MSQLSKLKQFKDLRKAAKEMQATLGKETSLGEGAGGKVKVVMNGNQEVLSADVSAELLAPEYKAKVDEGIKDAVNHAVKQIQKAMAKKMQAGELKIPDMSDLMK
jgi:DNA-binding protein YbaB